MKTWVPFARYKDTKTYEPFEQERSFADACAWSERAMKNPKNACFDLWGINVFDTKEDDGAGNYKDYWWEFRDGQWQWMHKGQGIEAK